MRRIIYLSFFLLSLYLFFPSVSYAAGPTHVWTDIFQDQTWTEENSPYIVHSLITVAGKLTVEPGTVVKFVDAFNVGLVFRNDFIVEGKSDKKVIFTSWHDDSVGGDSDGTSRDLNSGRWGYLQFNPGQNRIFKMENAVVKYASDGAYLLPSTRQVQDMIVRNCEFENNDTAISSYDGPSLIERNIIRNNRTGIQAVAWLAGNTAKAQNNAIYGNGVGAIGASPLNPAVTALDARYNWWGDEGGPVYHENASQNDTGNLVIGKVLYDPWIKEDPLTTPDPVIIIPGIMGSWEKNGKWQIDPIFHTYDDLIKAFVTAGYKNDAKSMSVFPYQWRDSNVENAKLLHTRIQQIKNETGRPKVDIVAHSMGGLLAREYIESSYYENDVDQLITVGTPHLGAPKDYIKWEAGAFFDDIFEQTGKLIFEHEAKENGYDNVFHYIRNRPMESVRELLPVYDYLYDDNGSGYDLRIGYPANYPRNEFLENLNSSEKVKVLKNVGFTKIIGKTDSETSTVSNYNVVDDITSGLWKHGYPKHFDLPVLNRQGIVKSSGDGTVPLYSSEASQVPADKKIYFQSEHNDLPTNAQQDIIKILTGKRPVSKIDEWQVDDIIVGLVHSPVDIQVISPSGKRLGKNFETDGEYNEIEGAYYTGFDTNTEFLAIPNPEDGEYQIISQGTGNGDYKIEMAKITGSEDGQAEKASAVIEGTAEEGEMEETIVKVEGNTVEKTAVPEPEPDNPVDTPENTDNSSGGDNAVIGSSETGESNNQTNIQKLDVLKGKVRQYFKSNQIKKRKVSAEITKRLSHIRVYLKRYETETSPKKKKIAKTKANADIEKLIAYINKIPLKTINEEAKESLIEDINDLKID